MPEKEKLIVYYNLFKRETKIFLNENERTGGTQSRSVRQHVKI